MTASFGISSNRTLIGSSPGVLAVFGAGAISGMALMFASVNYNYDPRFGQQIRYTGMFYTGLGLFLASIITGSVLASQDDEAYVNVYPTK